MSYFGPDPIIEAEKNVSRIRENLKITQSRQKRYTDIRRRDLTFRVGDHVYLKVSLLWGIKRFHARENLAPRYIGPYPII